MSRRQLLKGMAAAGGASMAAAATGFGTLAGATPPAAGSAELASASGSAAKLTGTLVFPSDPAYDAARALWDGVFVSYPLVVVFCQNATDVVHALAWSRQHGVGLRPRSGRHCLEGWSSLDGGVVVDVSHLKSVSYNPANQTVKIGTGLTQGEMVAALAKSGRTIPSGSEASVGMGGVTLGGGIGTFARHMGLTCDNLVALDMVVPQGSSGAQLLHVDRRHHPDLLWASRGGGGGNFGIATSFTFATHPMPTVSHFTLTWDWSNVSGVFNAWQHWAPRVDRRLGSTFAVLPKSTNQLVADGLFTGSPATLRTLLRPLLAVGSPKVTIETLPYDAYFAKVNSGPRQMANWRFSSSWVYKPLPAAAMAVVERFMAVAPAPGCNYWCLNWGGATEKPPPGGSAFPWRKALYFAEPGAGWNDPAQSGPVEIWLSQFRQAMRPFVEGAYVNVPDGAFGNWGELYYGPHFARLRRVKSAYDPANVFNFAQSIPPAR